MNAITEKEADAKGYLTLEEVTAGRRTKFMGVFPSDKAKREVINGMVPLVAAGQSLTDALEVAGENTDKGDTYLSRYDLRLSVGRMLARAASDLNTAKKACKPADVVRQALANMDAPVPQIGRPSVARVLAVA